MSSNTPKTGAKAATEREARLKAALKSNLARRKQQARARGTGKTASHADPTAGPQTDKNKG
ncbi:hypothetical protein [Algirhabdus cladophorae]|uniref:hypothetical protein n=1 Tax=Algirhabdus cladophorae TaxID=3377108 RepID=UPI003B84A6FA